MIRNILQRWKTYKYRFVPWMATNISESAPRIVSSLLDDKILGDTELEKCLLTLFTEFEKRGPCNHDSSMRHELNMATVEDVCGFTLERRTSLLENGGRGVFVASGQVYEGSLVAFYPDQEVYSVDPDQIALQADGGSALATYGLVYQPREPVFFVSLANSFLFHCADGIHIDGKDKGLSKMMYNSCAKRDSVCGKLMCDTSWLTETPANPLAIGQYVNNQSKEFAANVAYQEFDVPANFPQHLRQYIPNTEARLQQDIEQHMPNRLLRMVVLVSLREISVGEELFSTYYTIVHSKNLSV